MSKKVKHLVMENEIHKKLKKRALEKDSTIKKEGNEILKKELIKEVELKNEK